MVWESQEMEETKKIDEEMAILSGSMQLGEKEVYPICNWRAWRRFQCIKRSLGIYLVFDVKMDEIRKKRANKCTDDHKMAFLASVTYSSTDVLRNSVWLVLSVAALNGLDVQEGADVQNVRLNASNGERVWMRARPEFGDDEEKYLIVV